MGLPGRVPVLVLPEKKDFIFGASYGIVTLQDFHDFDTQLIARGM